MNRRTPAVLLAGILVAATAAMAIPVAPAPDRDGAADGIQAGWSHTSRWNGEVADIWWTVWGRCSPDFLGERLICDALEALTRAGRRTFESKTSTDLGLPLPGGWDLMTANNSPFIRSAHVETPLDLAAVLGFYRAALDDRGWTENEGAAIEPDRIVIGFTTADGPGSLRLTRRDGKTIADLSLRKRPVATAGFLPKPEQGRLMLGNNTDGAAVVTVNERTIRLAAHAGKNLANSDDAAAELPESQKLDLSPGKYKVTLTVDGSPARSREFEVAANETWGLLVETHGVMLPVHLY
ncbi:hypothetical protein ACFQZO_28895 [Bradyrhizobium sp. GCM10027634]|uniref:hypothetical protein n=1 Tax=unclassified Bradyrhizobium TaxID=2631580 RepID=UPI00188C5287|nr:MULTISPECIES: hypothetical protein [unclassified Bradyrhizobium]MDN5004876.1 hypothetical protein [Bradyrhizobium sp. WYCCWR 12677]QOZ45199.1 hypothetical protein XH89_18235 [Bradyrhizobium sp. CCBAU 53340]